MPWTVRYAVRVSLPGGVGSTPLGIQVFVRSSRSMGRHLPLVEVMELVLAQDLGEGVHVVRRRGGGAPRIVAAVPQQDVEVDAGERGSAGVDARPVDVLLH